jgi:hypothetical protein
MLFVRGLAIGAGHGRARSALAAVIGFSAQTERFSLFQSISRRA